MFKTIIVAKTIAINIIWWVNINQFDLPAELLFEGVEGNEVVTFDDEVFAYNPVFVPFECANFVLFIVNTPPFTIYLLFINECFCQLVRTFGSNIRLISSWARISLWSCWIVVKQILMSFSLTPSKLSTCMTDTFLSSM